MDQSTPLTNIRVIGAKVHNLKNISVDIPRGKLTVLTGISGSGKSSLAFDTIFAEGQRRYVESLSSFARQFLGILEKPEVDKILGLSPALSIDQKSTIRSPRSTVGTMSEIYDYLRLMYASVGVPHCSICQRPLQKQLFESEKDKQKTHSHWRCPIDDYTFPNISISTFSFNSPVGACPACQGLGKRLEVDAEQVLPNPRLTLAEGAIRPWQRINAGMKWQRQSLESLITKNNISDNIPVGELSKKQREIILYGDGVSSGVIEQIKLRHAKTDSEFIRRELEKFMVEVTCPECQGGRLKKEILNILVNGKNILEINNLTVQELYQYVESLITGQKLTVKQLMVISQLLSELKTRVGFLIDVGLSYLTISRSSTTLSGGEAQRIRLGSQLGSQLVGVIYILDEPSIGLHPRDHSKLLASLVKLKEGGNTVVVVEHDKETILAADYIIDVGPGAGEQGGEIVAVGTKKDFLKQKNSLTVKYLIGAESIPTPKKRREGSKKILKIIGADANNLQKIDVAIPLEKLVCISGVSGSGKSTLVNDILAKALAKKYHHAQAQPAEHQKISGTENIDKVIIVNQDPIGRNIRSNPATYTGIFGPLRELYASLPEAQNLKLTPAHFSFNLKGGRCEKCHGDGVIRFEMHFLPNVFVECEECHGARYKDEILHVNYSGKNISEVLEMTVDSAIEFFTDFPEIVEKLAVLQKVGLGYIRLGQPATELSGGEAQRVKLATELMRPATGQTLYILDEPTSGLHFDDIKKLLKVLHALVDRGNTVLIVEHNMDVIKNADWVIDLGPDGGEAGGRIVATGTPEEVAQVKFSHTGKYLKEAINPRT